MKDKSIRLCARIPLNSSPAAIEFIRNQNNFSKTLLRLVEDAATRFGTQDIFLTTQTILCNTSLPNSACEMDIKKVTSPPPEVTTVFVDDNNPDQIHSATSYDNDIWADD